MSIYTRYGNKVIVIGKIKQGDETLLKVQRLEDNAIRVYSSWEFRADGGAREIEEASINAPLFEC